MTAPPEARPWWWIEGYPVLPLIAQTYAFGDGSTDDHMAFIDSIDYETWMMMREQCWAEREELA